ncbi:MAG TPA: MFS transporter [Terriglobales bacterium]|nr:MFS transporter [Terriglobales bacterium]
MESTGSQTAAATAPSVDQRWLRIIPVALLMYIIAFVDRTNISLALPSMSRVLHMDSAQAGSAAGIFFWGYLLLQIPGGYLAHRWSAKRFVAILLVLWALCAIACGLVHTAGQFWWMRLLLGVAEGGVWPAVLVLLANWFRRNERARANAFWMVCLPLAVVISAPISGWILDHWNWRVMLVAEGVLPLLWLGPWLAFMKDKPTQASWLPADQRNQLLRDLEREAEHTEYQASDNVLRALLRPQAWLMVGVYFSFASGMFGYIFWLPSAVEGAKRLSNTFAGVLFAIPFLVGALSMVALSYHSDVVKERRCHVSVALAWAGVLLVTGVLVSNAVPVLAYVLICLVGAGIYGMMGPFWAIPTETLPSRLAGPTMGLVNAFGNLGGYFGPLTVGYLKQRTGNFHYAFLVLAAVMLAGAGLALLLPRSRASLQPGIQAMAGAR